MIYRARQVPKSLGFDRRRRCQFCPAVPVAVRLLNCMWLLHAIQFSISKKTSNVLIKQHEIVRKADFLHGRDLGILLKCVTGKLQLIPMYCCLVSYQVCIETYVSSCHQRSINTAVRATLSQMLSDLTLQLRQKQENMVSLLASTNGSMSMAAYLFVSLNAVRCTGLLCLTAFIWHLHN